MDNNQAFQVALIGFNIFLAILTSKSFDKKGHLKGQDFVQIVGILYFGYGFCYILGVSFFYKQNLRDQGFLWVFALSFAHDVVRFLFFVSNRTRLGILRDGLFNLCFFCGVYLLITYNNIGFFTKLFISLFLILSIGRILKFRVFYQKKIYKMEIDQYPSRKWQRDALLVQPAVDYGIRTIIHYCLSMSLIFITWFFSGSGQIVVDNNYFKFENVTGETIITKMMYYVFNIFAGLGYGDTIATSPASRFVSAGSSVFALILYGWIIKNIYDMMDKVYKQRDD